VAPYTSQSLLLDHHRRRLRSFGITDELLGKSGVRSVTDQEAREAGIVGPKSSDLSGLLYEYRHPASGALRAVRVRRDNPEIENGKPKAKYRASRDPNCLYFPPIPKEFLYDTNILVVIVEAQSSALATLAALARLGRQVLTIATGGAWNWRGRIGKTVSPSGARVDEKGVLPDLDFIIWNGRNVVILLDSNALHNPSVHAAEWALARELARRNAHVRLGRMPTLPDINGPDDLIAAQGDDALAAVVDSAVEWTRIVPEPRPLQRQLPPSEPFPMEALGPVLAPAARRIASVIQAPAALCATSVLAAATLAVQAHADVVIDGRVSPTSNFFITLGVSGERKSAVDRQALSPHRKYQKTLCDQFAQEEKTHRNALDAYTKAREEALKKAKGLKAKQQVLIELGDFPVPPLRPQILVEEPTYEGLVKLLAVGQPSLGLFSDEGGRFIGGHGMKDDNLVKTAAGLSGLWDGTPISRVRSGDGDSLLYGRRLTTHLMVQPEIAQMLLSNQVLLNQGLLSRCLCTSPESTVGTRFYVEEDLSTSKEILLYESRLTEILQARLPLADGQKNALAPRQLSLSPEAKILYIRFHNAVEKELAASLQDIRGFANKAPEHAVRLAAVLQLAESLDCESIDVGHMANGIDITKHYLGESLRMLDAGQTDTQLTLADKLLVWLRERGGPVIAITEIYQWGPNSVRSAKTARDLMHILEEHGWVLPIEKGTVIDGKFHREVWRVNL
jgi:hypothetical protein